MFVNMNTYSLMELWSVRGPQYYVLNPLISTTHTDTAGMSPLLDTILPLPGTRKREAGLRIRLPIKYQALCLFHNKKKRGNKYKKNFVRQNC